MFFTLFNWQNESCVKNFNLDTLWLTRSVVNAAAPLLDAPSVETEMTACTKSEGTRAKLTNFHPSLKTTSTKSILSDTLPLLRLLKHLWNHVAAGIKANQMVVFRHYPPGRVALEIKRHVKWVHQPCVSILSFPSFGWHAVICGQGAWSLGEMFSEPITAAGEIWLAASWGTRVPWITSNTSLLCFKERIDISEIKRDFYELLTPWRHRSNTDIPQ